MSSAPNAETVRQTLQEEFELLKADILAAYNQTVGEPSANWAKTIAIQQLPNGIRMVADGYINGRGPGKPPPSAAIAQWLVQKGISARLEGEITTGALAFLIARKIGRMGWKPKHNLHDIVAGVATPQRIEAIIRKTGAHYVTGLSLEITKYLQSQLPA